MIEANGSVGSKLAPVYTRDAGKRAFDAAGRGPTLVDRLGEVHRVTSASIT